MAGHNVLAAIDVDATLQSAHKLNFPKTKTINASVIDIDARAWQTILGDRRPDIVIGGPPCQGFSRIGRRNLDDPRNSLVGHFFQQVLLLKPAFFVMENVPGILDPGGAEILQEAIATVGSVYKVSAPRIINAKDFGAATGRRRVIVIGARIGEVDDFDFERVFEPRLAAVTVREAISDLPAPLSIAESKAEWGWSKLPQPSEISPYAARLRRASPEHLGWAYEKRMRSEGMVSGLAATRHSEEISRRYASIVPGSSDPICKSHKLNWEGYAPTLRAGTGADKGSFQAVRPLHPTEGRVITVREAARLQSFPDWFSFHPTKWHSFRMIGNSVPPVVSEGILRRLAKFYNKGFALGEETELGTRSK